MSFPAPTVSTGPAAFPWFRGNRRDLLRVGSLSLSTALLPGLQAKASETARAKSVIFLWMAGGVTHLETFDPKPDAPPEVRGTLKPIATCLPGVHFAESMPCMARAADRISLLRSFSHDNNDHFMSQAWGLSGRKVPLNQILTEPNIGSIVSYLQGPRNDLPGYLAVPGWTLPGPPPTNLFVGGWLGAEYGPFSVGGEPDEPDFTKTAGREFNPSPVFDERIQPPALDLAVGNDGTRLSDRATLRKALDDRLRQVEQSPQFTALEGHYRNAMQLLQSAKVREAFDLAREPAAVREEYGATKIGNRCLLAARLVEVGARFVMVDYGYDPLYGNLWDNHNAPGQNFPHICEMSMRGYHCAGIDRAFAGLLLDLERRGLLDSTLVVFMTEFGRTPRINSLGGRDHWGPAGSIFFAGAGVKRGQVIGATDRQAAYPTTRGYTPSDVAASIYQAVGISAETILHDRENRPHAVLPEGTPITELL